MSLTALDGDIVALDINERSYSVLMKFYRAASHIIVNTKSQRLLLRLTCFCKLTVTSTGQIVV